jgi:hypothetical protein
MHIGHAIARIVEEEGVVVQILWQHVSLQAAATQRARRGVPDD